ncbi:putative HTH-type transcriptional regulator YybE [Paenibacillus sp. CCS19]|uniref:LysR family transcriptional regulator n=1 Tax=Paenibacillus sp. CCS19 TaxID=3158387 RepID=UPI00255FFEDC|nr:LysR family transcriptional regulator [Paenibacillus cellulosilyticus]GMK40670.1 putative HTH-type transcriptional regulator YybE [Paenibacillus cellulosilyticus]
MELAQMEYFLTVARLQHVTRAAEELAITQPALSHSLGKLEDELGVQLFERSGRNVQLNRYGELFAARVERVMQEIAHGKREIQELADPDVGLVEISFLNVLGASVIPDLLRQFHKVHPRIRLDLHQGATLDVYGRVDAGKSDFGFCMKREFMGSVAWEPIGSFELFAVVPQSHEWAGRSSIKLNEMEGQPYIGLCSRCGLQQSIVDLLASAGAMPVSTYEAEDLQTVAGFVSAGLGVSLLPKSKGLSLAGIAWIPLETQMNTFEIGIEWKARRFLSPAAQRFRDFVLNDYRYADSRTEGRQSYAASSDR